MSDPRGTSTSAPPPLCKREKVLQSTLQKAGGSQLLSEEEGIKRAVKNAVSFPEKYHLRIQYAEKGEGHSCPAKPADSSETPTGGDS